MALTAEMNHVKKTRMRVNHTGTTFRFVLVDRTSALMADHHEAQLKITPAIFVLGMFFALAIIGVIAQVPVIAFAAGVCAAVTASLFAFLSLYVYLHQEM